MVFILPTWADATCKYAGTLSYRLPLSSGVLQGSILGPLIFNLFLNRLLVSLPADNCIAYADDVTLVTNGSISSEAIQSIQLLLLNCLSN